MAISEQHSKNSQQVQPELDLCLSQLSGFSVQVPAGGEFLSLNLLDALKQVARSGKEVRIQAYGLNLPVQSHFDHVRAVGAIADVLVQPHGLSSDQLGSISKLIGFHDLAEVISFDDPAFTSPALKTLISQHTSDLSRDDANTLIGQSFPDALLSEFERSLAEIQRSDSLPVRLFELADKIEPITAVWRYLRCHRGEIRTEQFLHAMDDFFTNPGVSTRCFTEQQREAVDFFQTRKFAEDYSRNGAGAFARQELPRLARDLLEQVVETHDLHVVEGR